MLDVLHLYSYIIKVIREYKTKKEGTDMKKHYYTIYNKETGSKIADNINNLYDVKRELSGMKGEFEAIRTDKMYALFINNVQKSTLSKYPD
jgi:flagellin-specific chaperone FliS